MIKRKKQGRKKAATEVKPLTDDPQRREEEEVKGLMAAMWLCHSELWLLVFVGKHGATSDQ